MTKLLRNSVVYLLLFPFIGFLPTDIQPWFIIVAFVGLLLGASLRFTRIDTFFVLINLVLVTLYIIIYNQQIDLRSVLTWLLFSIMPVALSHFIDFERHKIVRLVSLSLFIYILVGLIQVYSGDFASNLVSRELRLDIIEASGRGVRSLTSEPSVFARILGKLALTLIILTGFRPMKQFFLILVNMMLSLSIYGIVVHIVIVAVVMAKRFFKILGLLVIIVALIRSDSIPGRAGFIISGVRDNPTILLEQGAFARVINLPISVKNTLNYWPEGSAVKVLPSSPESINTVIGEYNYFLAPRNLGGLIELPYRFGFLGLCSLLTFLYYFQVKSKNYKLLRVKLLVLFLFFQDGSIIDTFNWILLFSLSGMPLSLNHYPEYREYEKFV